MGTLPGALPTMTASVLANLIGSLAPAGPLSWLGRSKSIRTREPTGAVKRYCPLRTASLGATVLEIPVITAPKARLRMPATETWAAAGATGPTSAAQATSVQTRMREVPGRSLARRTREAETTPARRCMLPERADDSVVDGRHRHHAGVGPGGLPHRRRHRRA